MMRGAIGFGVTLWALAAGCSTGVLFVGDDSTPLADAGAVDDPFDAQQPPDAAHPPTADSGEEAASPDAAPPSCASSGGECLAADSPCRSRDTTGIACANAQFCCAVRCPALNPPSPALCDGGPVAPRYDETRCITGYACAPTDCVGAGGACVGLSPGACANGHTGDARLYSCDGGVGVMCCLP
jgi:hypothetical protein